MGGAQKEEGGEGRGGAGGAVGVCKRGLVLFIKSRLGDKFVVGPVLTAPRVVGSCGHGAYFARWRIFLRLRWRRRVRFFFHFQRILDVDFL